MLIVGTMLDDSWNMNICAVPDLSYDGFYFAIFLIKVRMNPNPLDFTIQFDTALTWGIYAWFFDNVNATFKYAT